MTQVIKKLRLQFNYSQSTVAQYLGVSRQMYCKYESGETEPSLKTVVLLSKLYKVSYSYLIDGDEEAGELQTFEQRLSKDFNISVAEPCAAGTSAFGGAASTAGMKGYSSDSLFGSVQKAVKKLDQEQQLKLISLLASLVQKKSEESSLLVCKQPEIEEVEAKKLFEHFSGLGDGLNLQDEKTKYFEAKYGLNHTVSRG